MTTTPIGSVAPVLRRTLWASLPALTLGSALLTAVAAPLLLLGAGTRAPSAGLLVLLLGSPAVGAGFATLQAQCCDVSAGLETRTADWPRYLRLAGGTGAIVFAAGGLAAAAFVAALRWWVSGSVPAVASVLAGGLVLGLAVPVLLLGVPVRLLRPELTGRSVALLCLHLTARRPVPVLGALALPVLAVVGAERLTLSVLVLLPAPLALTSVLAARALLGWSSGRPGVPKAATDRSPV